MKKQLLTFIAAGFIAGNLFGQQDPQFTQFFYNKLIMNPAYAGAKGGICATLLHRQQYVGFGGGPVSTLLSADMPIAPSGWGENEIGIGLTAYRDVLGFEKNYALRIAATYRRTNLGPGDFAVGFDIGFSNKGFGNVQWIPPAGPDPAAPPPGSSEFGFDIGLGVYYHTEDWYAGLSTLHLAAPRYGVINYKQARNLYLMGGYTFRNVFPAWDINPNVLVKTDFASAQLDVNANVIYNSTFWGGLSYRITDAVAINLGMNFGWTGVAWLKGLQVGYAYDIPTSRLNVASTGSHEILLRYCFVIEKITTITPTYPVRLMVPPDFD